MKSGFVFNIQRFSISDGPGIRTTVFMKGCNMRCFWCHNPESQELYPQIQFFLQKCIGCLKCVKICPHHAQLFEQGKRVYLRSLCVNCGKCAEVCNSQALVLIGKEMTVSEVMEKVTRDLPFYKISKGGVTFSGGEPLEQADFLRALLIECKKQNIHTAVDTAGNVSWEEFEKIIQYTDLFLYDIKCMDNEKHKQATGAENIRILENLRLIQSAGFQNEIWIRIPIIPGINDNEEEAKKVVNFIREFKGISKIDLLPFHKMGKEKYESLGMEYKAEELLPVREDVLEKLVQIYRKNGFDANIERG